MPEISWDKIINAPSENQVAAIGGSAINWDSVFNPVVPSTEKPMQTETPIFNLQKQKGISTLDYTGKKYAQDPSELVGQLGMDIKKFTDKTGITPLIQAANAIPEELRAAAKDVQEGYNVIADKPLEYLKAIPAYINKAGYDIARTPVDLLANIAGFGASVISRGILLVNPNADPEIVEKVSNNISETIVKIGGLADKLPDSQLSHMLNTALATPFTIPLETYHSLVDELPYSEVTKQRLKVSGDAALALGGASKINKAVTGLIKEKQSVVSPPQGRVEPQPVPPHLEPPIPESGLINRITLKEAGNMLAKGDKEVIRHIKEGIEQGVVSPMQMQDAIRNEALAKIADAPKSERPAIKENIKRIEPLVNEAIKGIEPAEVTKPLKAEPVVELPKAKPAEVSGKPEGAEEGTTLAFTSQLSAGMTPTPEAKAGGIPEAVVKRSDIIKELSEKLDVPIRIGKFKDKALGIFKVKPEVIRTKLANDVPVVSHEIGHFLDKHGIVSKSDRLKYKDELTALSSWMPQKLQGTKEGFAEYIRQYITDETKLQIDAPKFHEFFEKKMAENTDIRDILYKARADYKRWLEQPSTAKIYSMISFEDNIKNKLNFDKIYTATVDDLHPLEVAVKDMAKGGINVLNDPYILARLSRGWWGKVDHFLERQPFKFGTYKNIPDVKSLSDILIPLKNEIDNFRVYLLARRTLDVAKRGKKTGISIEDAQMAIKELKNEKFENAFNEIQKYQDATLQYLKDSGVLSDESYQRIKLLNEEYVPLYRVTESETTGGAGGITYANLFNPVKRLKGSTRDIIDPLESIIKNTYAFINIAERNAVGEALVKLAQQTHGGGKYAEKIPTPIRPQVITNEELYNIFHKFADWKEKTVYQEFSKTLKSELGIQPDGTISKPMEKLESIVRDALKSRGFSEGEANVFIHKLKTAKTGEVVNQVIENIVEKQTVIHTIKEMELNLPEIVNIFRPSQSIPKDAPIITVFRNGERELYQVSPEIYRSILALDRERQGMLIRFLAVPARLLRAGATLAPEFAVRNPIRDQFMAFVQSKYGYKPVIDFTKGLFHAIKKDDLYWDFKKSGAEHSMLVSLDRDYLKRNLKDLLAEESVFIPEAIKPSIIKHPIELLRILSEFGETGTRMGEFIRAAKKEGRTKEGLLKAGIATREVTIDFARVGAKTQAVNMIIAFWNARLQGLDKIVRTFREKPIEATAKTIAAITIPSILLYMANKDDERYKELPRWQKDLFWIILTKDHVWRIPKPFELGVLFGSFPERILEYIDTKNPEIFKNFGSTLWDVTKPGILPTAIVPIWENSANYSFFTERPIVPRYQEELEPKYQYNIYTTELAKRIGALTNQSPAKIENLIRGYTGGLGMLGLQGVNLAFKGLGIFDLPPTPTKTLSDIPLIRGFTVRYPSSNTQSIVDFYESYKKSQIAVRTYNALEREGRFEEADKYYEKHEKEINLSKPIGKISIELSDYNKLIRDIYNDKEMTSEQKRKAMDEIYLDMLEIVKKANEYIKDLSERR